ncbi:exodeoxyribonuclease VII small subunit [Domibacillus enclensis]|uniref:Exodeoxyribonuclease 7 small subunit n=1 Tax=Domibacillus enclensis TaxID=1017273 RepID=A0A1N6PGH4_9BACI|nr:exodeoxyribonuclease VII small subunit [Domibacillus enclensis]OXS80359.1 exodeoxyribonuclease VII small subunit [Domibacillus enclensis]SIQ03448.1 Exodeoxyribonuclease VII small subunit [Domibacillus enclensis]
MKKEELSFEQAMEQLEKITARLEEGDVPLEEALEEYKRGMELSAICHSKLKKAEDELAKLVTNEGDQPYRLDGEDA